MPALILLKNDNLAHAVRNKFGTQMLIAELYEMKDWKEWIEYDTIHLLVNHRSELDLNYNETKEFDEFNILNYNYTFGEMCREILLKMKEN